MSVSHQEQDTIGFGRCQVLKNGYHCMDKFGEKLRTLRERQQLTSRELGTILGVSNGHIIRIENGEKRPSIDLVAKIANFFHVSTDQLIFDERGLDEK